MKLKAVASFPIPEVIRNINSFTMGAQSVNPKVKTKVVWVNKWFDPPKEGEAAESLINQGADVLMQNTDSSAVLQTAGKAGKYAFGWDSDMTAYAPNAHLASAVINWAPYYINAVQDALDGTWKGGESSWDGLKDGILTMAPYTNMPDDVKKLAMDTEAAISSGKLHPFKCPVLGQDGKPVECKGGANLDDGQILSMNFFIKGIDDKLPAN